jgi:signal transduction histidine kinase
MGRRRAGSSAADKEEMHGRVPAGRLRRRLTAAFVLVAGLSAGALALGSFLLVRGSRLSESLERAEEEARFDLTLATSLQEQTDLQGFVTRYQQERRVRALLLFGEQRFASSPGVDLAVPSELRAVVQRGELGYQRLEVGGAPFLVVGGRPPGSDAELYFLFPEERIHRDLAELRNVLVVGWLAVVALAAVVGRALARRTLEPVARASQAARSLAEGLLATRLPVESEDEFGAWAASFNEMAEALGTKIKALSEAQARERRFTSDVAHELRTPLAALVGEASLLREQLDRMPPEARRPAELLAQDVARLRRLVDELMEISRFDAGREGVRSESVDLRALVEATVRSRGWDAKVEVSGEDVVLSSDRRRMERIVANLAGNAVEHGGGSARVRVGREARGAFVEVLDRGPGIPSEHLLRLFDRFYKADPARSGAGSGLGLAIALENARLLGGDIEVWSELGVGSRFTLRIPVTEPLPGSEGAVAFVHDDGAHSPQKGERT